MTKSKPRLHVDGMMGTMENVTTNQFSIQKRNMSLCFNTHPWNSYTYGVVDGQSPISYCPRTLSKCNSRDLL